MKVYHNISDYRNVRNPIATIGTFDGVHIGHQQIINRLKEIAKEEDGEVGAAWVQVGLGHGYGHAQVCVSRAARRSALAPLFGAAGLMTEPAAGGAAASTSGWRKVELPAWPEAADARTLDCDTSVAVLVLESLLKCPLDVRPQVP